MKVAGLRHGYAKPASKTKSSNDYPKFQSN